MADDLPSNSIYPTPPDASGGASSVPQTPINASTTSLNSAGHAPRLIDLPQHAQEQGHHTLEITMPADQTSHGLVEHFELQPVGKHEKVRGDIVKDKKVSCHDLYRGCFNDGVQKMLD